MLRFAANITLLFRERPFLERFSAARAAGFTGVDIQFHRLVAASESYSLSPANLASLSLYRSIALERADALVDDTVIDQARRAAGVLHESLRSLGELFGCYSV